MAGRVQGKPLSSEYTVKVVHNKLELEKKVEEGKGGAVGRKRRGRGRRRRGGGGEKTKRKKKKGMFEGGGRGTAGRQRKAEYSLLSVPI